jgi:hypothetical protein
MFSSKPLCNYVVRQHEVIVLAVLAVRGKLEASAIEVILRLSTDGDLSAAVFLNAVLNFEVGLLRYELERTALVIILV